MDFGIARMIQREGPMTGTIVGTPAYMAPEQADLRPVSSCTDIYAVGLVLYEMVTGIPAFSGDTPVAVAIKQIQDYPQRPREIVPQLSRAIESVIMKCLQKDPARRFQSAEALEIALVKAAKARPLSPWEASLNRYVAIAEAEIRRHIQQGMVATEKLFEQKDCTPPVGIQNEPKAMLGFAGMVGALTVFLIVGGWRTRTANAQTIQAGAPTSHVAVSAASSAAPASPDSVPEANPTPMTSVSVNLYENTKAEDVELSPVVSNSSNANQVSASATPADTPAKAALKSRAAKVTAVTPDRKVQKKIQNSTAGEIAASPVESAALVASTNLPAPNATPVLTPLESSTASQPAVDAGSAANQPKAVDDDPKVAKLFVEVGTFKDETWASSAVDKLTQLGFHAVMVHKNMLWVQSYHVQVGPYANPQELAEAQKSLASHGFKAHPVS